MLVKVSGFVVCLSFGTLSLLVSTVFLLGPVQQLKRMYHPTRIVALIVFLVCLGLAIYSGIQKKLIPAVIFGILEIIAFLWYALSYIPYARTLALKLVGL